VPLKFAAEISSKSAHEGDPWNFCWMTILKWRNGCGRQRITRSGHGVECQESRMMGKPGELNVQLQYLVVGSNHVHLRGTKGKREKARRVHRGADGTLGPIGLIKHGKDVQIPRGRRSRRI